MGGSEFCGLPWQVQVNESDEDVSWMPTQEQGVRVCNVIKGLSVVVVFLLMWGFLPGAGYLLIILACIYLISDDGKSFG